MSNTSAIDGSTTRSAQIGFVLHGADDDALRHAERLAGDLRSRGHRVVALVEDARRTTNLECVEPESFAHDLDLAVSLGGDGTMLRTVRLLAGADVRILGVNFGDLGYLTVIEPNELEAAVERTLSGDHQIESRMLVSGTIDGDPETLHALNDIVIERSPGDTTVRIAVAIDGMPFTTYAADGLIVASPTGSTAYALSARGPVVSPTHSSLQLTPVSPHMLFDRTIVLGPESEIELTVDGHREAVVSVDGLTMRSMEPGQRIVIRRSERTARLVTFGRRDHLGVLTSKLGLRDR